MTLQHGRLWRGVLPGWISAWIALLLLSMLILPLMVQAKGPALAPADFGYGAQVDHGGDHVGIAFFLASELGLDWVGMDFDWARTWPERAAKPDFDRLDRAMAMAVDGDLPVLLKITNAPAWALTPRGPDPSATTELISRLVNRSPALQAIELFPGANTTAGWGTTPDPVAYLSLLREAKTQLKRQNRRIHIIAAGLTPLPPGSNTDDIDDLRFLETLYANGGAPLLHNLSLRLTETTGKPDDSPFTMEQPVLRHYESVREIMLQYGHQEGMIWITSFTWPSGKISPDDSKFGDPNLQAQWLHQAYNLLSAQLYIKVAFFDRLNPPQGDANPEHQYHSLIRPAGNFHPGLRSLGHLMSYDGSLPEIVSERIFQKKLHYWKAGFKPDL